MLALRKVRTYEDELDLPTFAEHALDVYIKAHTALADKKYDSLHDFVTEHAFPHMTFKTNLKTIKWQFISAIEKPLVSHVRTLDVLSKNNLFAQMTVRLHTRQILAIYDRFGILMHGSDAVVKDVLEYVVFEKHIANLYGTDRRPHHPFPPNPHYTFIHFVSHFVCLFLGFRQMAITREDNTGMDAPERAHSAHIHRTAGAAAQNGTGDPLRKGGHNV
jgi:hypothetical protein